MQMHLFVYFISDGMNTAANGNYLSLTIFSWLEIKLDIWEQEGIQDHFILTEENDKILNIILNGLISTCTAAESSFADNAKSQNILLEQR